jgi:DNA-binding HxlR family transcriptional regulator
MEQEIAVNSRFVDSDCARKIRAIDDTMDILSGKWKISILARLGYKPMRYSELLRDINGIAGKVLSRELKDLEMNGLISRHVSQTQPLSVTYNVTTYGLTLKSLTDSIADWGLHHRERIIASQKTIVDPAAL